MTQPGTKRLVTEAAIGAHVATQVSTPGTATQVALSATYLAQVTPINGEAAASTTARINAALSTAASFGARRVVRLVGAFTINAPLVASSNTTLDASGATIALAAGSNCNLLQNAQVSANNGRDTDIEIIGGTWDKGGNSGSLTGLHGLIFRRLDGLRVRGVKYKSTSGKYGINVGDVTDFIIESINFAASSDGIHINGLCRNGVVRRITGSTGDDSVAITGNDYVNYADTVGDVANILIEDVNTTSALANNVKILSGLNCTVTDIEVRHVRGTAAQHGVWVGYDGGQANTDNGSYGVIRIRDVDVTLPTNANGCNVFANFRVDGIDTLEVLDTITPAGVGVYALWVGLATGSTVKNLKVRPKMREGAAGKRLVRVLGGKVENFQMDSPMAREVSGAVALELSSLTSITTALITNPQLSATDTSTSDWIKQAAGCPIGNLTILGGRIAGGRGVAELRDSATVVLDGGLRVEPGTNGINRLGNIYGTALTTWIFGSVNVGNTINRKLIANETSSIAVKASNAAVVATDQDLFQRSAAQPLRAVGATIRADLTVLTPQADDQVVALAARGTIAVGALAQYRGGTWKDLWAATSYTP